MNNKFVDAKLESMNVYSLIQMINDKVTQQRIELNPVYQRDIVWDEIKMSGFIDSIICNIIPSNIILCKNDDIWICIDGKQRLTALQRFIKNEIPWINEHVNDNDGENINYIYYNGLLNEQKNAFNDTMIPVVSYRNLTYEMQIDIFQRIQNGVIVKPSEVIFSYFENENNVKKFRDFVNEHNYDKCTRYDHVNMLLQIIYMDQNDTTNFFQKITASKKKSLIKQLEKKNLSKILKRLSKNINYYFTEIISDNIFIKKYNKLIVVIFHLLNSKKMLDDKPDDKTIKKLRSVIKGINKKWNNKNNIYKGKYTNIAMDEFVSQFNDLYDDEFNNNNNGRNNDISENDNEDDNDNDTDDNDDDNDADNDDDKDENDKDDDDKDDDESDNVKIRYVKKKVFIEKNKNSKKNKKDRKIKIIKK